MSFISCSSRCSALVVLVLSGAFCSVLSCTYERVCLRGGLLLFWPVHQNKPLGICPYHAILLLLSSAAHKEERSRNFEQNFCVINCVCVFEALSQQMEICLSFETYKNVRFSMSRWSLLILFRQNWFRAIRNLFAYFCDVRIMYCICCAMFV